MKIVTFNANGIRSAARKGFYSWLSQTAPDVVCIQELKAQPDQLEDELFSPAGYRRYLHCAEKKGYSGVGIYTRAKPDRTLTGIGWPDFDSEGRFARIDFDKLSIISIYMLSGQQFG